MATARKRATMSLPPQRAEGGPRGVRAVEEGGGRSAGRAGGAVRLRWKPLHLGPPLMQGSDGTSTFSDSFVLHRFFYQGRGKKIRINKRTQDHEWQLDTWPNDDR